LEDVFLVGGKQSIALGSTKKSFEHTTMVEDVNFEDNSTFDATPIIRVDDLVERFHPSL